MIAVSRKVFLALYFSLALACFARAEQTRIRMATLAPQGTSLDHLLRAMGEQWNKAPEGGRVAGGLSLAARWGESRNRQAHAHWPASSYGLLTADGLGMIDPSVKALQQIPLMYRSSAELDYVRSHMESRLEQRMEEKGFVMLAWSMVGFARHFSKQSAAHSQDFLRLKLCVGADDTREIQILNSIGGHPVGLDWTNALTALQTGMVDGITTLPIHALGAQFNTAVSNMLDLKWVPHFRRHRHQQKSLGRAAPKHASGDETSGPGSGSEDGGIQQLGGFRSGGGHAKPRNADPRGEPGIAAGMGSIRKERSLAEDSRHGN